MSLVPKRDKTLEAEMMRQQNNERLRLQFAEKANPVGQWTEKKLDFVTNMGLQKGTLEDHMAKLSAIEEEVAQYHPNFDMLEAYNQEVQQAMVFENRHTQYTMEVSFWCTVFPGLIIWFCDFCLSLLFY